MSQPGDQPTGGLIQQKPAGGNSSANTGLGGTEEVQPKKRSIEGILNDALHDHKNVLGGGKKEKAPQDSELPDLSGKTDEELGLVKFTEADYDMVDQVVFRGYAEKEIKFGPDGRYHAILTTSTSGEEIVMETILMEVSDSGEMSPQMFQQYMGMLLVSLSLKSMHGKDYPENPALNLDRLKNAFKVLLEFERAGKEDKYKEQFANIIKLVKGRLSYVKEMPTPIAEKMSKERSKIELVIKTLLDGGILKNS